ncbi:MAG: SDR family oxidoreductase [Clostridiales Family XIII bacterium]|nr:SDR family oxidoreductase [Clostridiales Family XIII bacterium]
MKDYFGFEGKTCVVTGSASGVGKAAYDTLLELGAEVYGLDFNEHEGAKNYLYVDMSDKSSIDAVIGSLPDRIDSLFSIAALPGYEYCGKTFSLEQLFATNYSGPKYLAEQLLPRMPKGSSSAVTSSVAGGRWPMIQELLSDLYFNYSTFETSLDWVEKNRSNPQAFAQSEKMVYGFTKACVTYFVKRASFKFLKEGVRLNALCPGSIETGMSEDFARQSKQEGMMDGILSDYVFGTNPYINRQSTPQEQANAIIFLNSELATYVNGADFAVDCGAMTGMMLGQFKGTGEILDDR